MLNYLVPKLYILLWMNFGDGKRPNHCCQLTVTKKNDILIFDTSCHKAFKNLCIVLWIEDSFVFAGSFWCDTWKNQQSLLLIKGRHLLQNHWLKILQDRSKWTFIRATNWINHNCKAKMILLLRLIDVVFRDCLPKLFRALVRLW